MSTIFTSEQFAGIVRHVVTVLGTLLAARGYLAGGVVETLAGVAATVGATIHSAYAKSLAAKQQTTPAPPQS